MNELAPHVRVIRFGIFEIDLSSGELRRSGVRVRIQEQPFRILTALVRRSGEVVSREDLRAAVWPDGTFVEFDHALNTAVKKLRQVLGDSADTPRYIETIARRGYRFLLPVAYVPDSEARPAAIAAETVRPAVRPGKRWAIALVILLFGAAAALLTARYFQSSTAPISSIAVLPFSNVTGDPAEDYVADGLTELLITRLATTESLRVLSRTSVLQYRNVKRPLPDIARELHADALVEGAVVRLGKTIRVTAKLIDGRTDRLLWAREYERDWNSIGTIDAEVAKGIAGRLARGRPSEAAAAPPLDTDTYLLYLRARYHLNTGGRPNRATAEFRQVIARRPGFAPAYSGLADALLFGLDDTPPLEAMLMAKAAAQKAIDLDAQLAEAYAARATVQMFLDHDWNGSEASFRKALQLNDGLAATHQRYGQLLAVMRRPTEAIAQAHRAVELDPLNPFGRLDYGRTLFFARRFDEAAAQYRTLLAAEPYRPLTRLFLISAYEQEKKYDVCVEEIRQALRAGGASAQDLAGLDTAYRSGGYPAVLRIWTSLLVENQRDKPFVQSSAIALLYARQGDAEHAVVALQRSVASHTRDTVYLNIDPQYDLIRSDPRFDAITRSLGLP